MSSEETNQVPNSVDELKVGMKLNGIVKKLELYGAFVDVGLGQDALLHISQLGKPNVRNVEDVVKVDDQITVYVLRVDKETGRIALSLSAPPALSWDEIQEGRVFTGTIQRIEKFGVFVDIGAERPGMVHVSEMADGYVKSPSDIVSTGEEVQVRVIRVNRKKRQIDLSMKTEAEPVAVIEDDEPEEFLTAMELAYRKAMAAVDEGEEETRPAPARSKSSKRSRRSEHEDILARTLRDHSSK